MKIKKIILDQFKGVSHLEIPLSDKPIIKGQNGSGKTTVADSWYWLMSDKDYSLRSNPEIHPDFLEESEPSVTAVCDMDGKEVVFRKFQKDSRTKKQKEAGAPVRISNQFEVNAVPKSQKDFYSALTEYGIDVENFLRLSHPEIFTGMKPAECRNILFGMTSDITDRDIALAMPECADVAELLDSYTVEEVMAMQRKTKKEADQNLDAIPEQIIGMERVKVQIDVKGLTEEKDKLDEIISSTEQYIKDNPLPSVGEYNQQIASLESEIRVLENTANAERMDRMMVARKEEDSLTNQLRELESKRDHILDQMAEQEKRKAGLQSEFDRLEQEFKAVKAMKFDESQNVCQFCGQALPSDKAEENRKKFQDLIESKKREINLKAAGIKKELSKIVPDLLEELPDEREIQKLSDARNAKKQEISDLSVPIDIRQTDEYQEIMTKIDAVKKQIAELDDAKRQRSEMESELSERIRERNAINDQLAQVKVNEHIDKQIAEAKELQRNYAQASLNAEKILHQLSLISMKKNNLLEDQVNSHFSKVKFRLFEQLKNGEYKDCCIPTIDGKVIGESANTAKEIMAKLDIISGLQKFYGQDLPVFLDGAECLDSVNSNIDVPYQLVMLKVSDDKELVIETIENEKKELGVK